MQSKDIPSAGKPSNTSSKKKSDGSSMLKNAKNAAIVVEYGIQNDKIMNIGKALKKVATVDKDKETYVYDRLSMTRWWVIIGLGVSFSLLFLYNGIIGLGTAVFSGEYRLFGIIALVISVLVLAFNVYLIKNSFSEILFLKRYDEYRNVLRYRKYEVVRDLADMVEIDARTVVKDLNKAVEEKLIPQGHFGRKNLIFMVSDKTYSQYSKHKAAYDRYFKKSIEERDRMRSRDSSIKDMLEEGQQYIEKIQDCNALIKDKETSRKLDRMERVVAAIFHEVEINPAQASKLGVFMNYYLPTTEKLLESYLDMGEKRVKGKSVNKALNDINNALDSINDAYEGLLERFYEEQELDVASDISALETIMKQEGLQKKKND